MKKKILILTETALMLALLITLQWVTKPFGQILTGTCVNGVLFLTCVMVGLPGALAVAVLSPVFAFSLGIAPNLITVPVIITGNSVLVVCLWALYRNSPGRKLLAVAVAAVGKFAWMFVLINFVICGPAAQGLLDAGVMKGPMLAVLPATFGAVQLLTAAIGGAVGAALSESLKKALGR